MPKMAALALPCAIVLVSCAAIWGFQDLPAGVTDGGMADTGDTGSMEATALDTGTEAALDSRVVDAPLGCEAGATQCSGSTPQTCLNGQWVNGTACSGTSRF